MNDFGRFTPWVRALPKFSLRSMGVNYFPGPALYREEHDVHMHVDPVRQLRAQRSFERRAADPTALYWKFTANTSHKKLKLGTQKTRLKRRWSEAFAVSLLRYGFDRKGRTVGNGDSLQGFSGPSITGTLEVTIHDGLGFDEHTAMLIENTDKIVKALLKFQDGSYVASPRPVQRKQTGSPRW